MSYDLYFWRPQGDLSESPSSILDRVGEEGDHEGLTWLSVSELKARFVRAFPTIKDCGTYLLWDDEKGSFFVDWIVGSKPQHTFVFFVECSWSLPKHPEILDRITQIPNEMGCGIYDPQEDNWQEPTT